MSAGTLDFTGVRIGIDSWIALRRHPRSSPADIADFRDRRLRRMIAHAHRHVLHYREWLDRAGVPPETIRVAADLERVPPISKSDLRARPFAEIIANGVDPAALVVRKTSGSSGRPFTIRRSAAEDHLLDQFRLRALREFGVRLADRIALVLEPPLGGHAIGRLGRLRRALGIRVETRIDCFRSAEAILDELSCLRPDVVMGYPSVLERLADVADARRDGAAWPRLVVSGGESLGVAARDRVRSVFGAPVFDVYGAHEFNLLAWECRKTGAFHVCDDNVFLEVLRDGRPVEVGEVGEVVATGLHTFAMPFIRYRTGDLAVRGEEACPCGSPFTTLRAIRGRTGELLRLPGGRTAHPYDITGRLIAEIGWRIGQHQMIQEADDRIVLRLTKRREIRAEDLERIRALGARALGPDVSFRVEVVERFPATRSGKFAPYVNAIGRGSPPAEHDAIPAAFLVHDPVSAGSFAALSACSPPPAFERETLFREAPDARRYSEQHRAFVELLRKHATSVVHLEELLGEGPALLAAAANPNQVFTRDGLVTLPWCPGGFITARMAKPIRRNEPDTMETAARALGLREIVRVPPGLVLEGGDVIPFSRGGRRTLLVGYGPRTGEETLDFLQQMLLPDYADEIVGIALADWRINLDGGLLPVAPDVVLADPGSLRSGVRIDRIGREPVDPLAMLRDLGMRIVEVTRDESIFQQACNAVCLGERAVIYYDLCPRVREQLVRCDVTVHVTSGSELVKGRGGPRCMTRPIYAVSESASAGRR